MEGGVMTQITFKKIVFFWHIFGLLGAKKATRPVFFSRNWFKLFNSKLISRNLYENLNERKYLASL